MVRAGAGGHALPVLWAEGGPDCNVTGSRGGFWAGQWRDVIDPWKASLWPHGEKCEIPHATCLAQRLARGSVC